MYHKNGSAKWQSNGNGKDRTNNRANRDKDHVDELIDELNERSYVLTTKIKFLNYVHNNTRIKDANVALEAWNILMNSQNGNGQNAAQNPMTTSGSSNHSRPHSSSSFKEALSSRITRPNQTSKDAIPQNTGFYPKSQAQNATYRSNSQAQKYQDPDRPAQNSFNSTHPAQNLHSYPKVLARKPKHPPQSHQANRPYPKRDPMQFAREKIRHLQNKINFRANMQDAFTEAKDKGVKKLIEELLLFEKNVPYTEERFKNFLKHNMKVGDEELVHKIWTGIMYGFDEDGIKDSGYHDRSESIEDESKHETVAGETEFFWDYYDAEYDSMDEILADLYDKDE